MRYFFFVLFSMCLMVLVIQFYNCGYASFKYSKYNLVDFCLSEKTNNKLSLKFLWRCKVGCGGCGDYVNLYPDYEKSYIFVVDRYGIVKKLHFDTGKCIWSKKISNVFSDTCIRCSNSALLSGSVSVSNQVLYFGSELAKVYALDVNTGALLWVSEVSGEVISKPVVSHGLVLVYTSNGVFQALDIRNGILRWNVSFEVPMFSFRVTLLPVISDDIVILGDSSGVIHVCDINTGQLIWQKKISSLKGLTDIDRLSDIVAPVVENNVVYALAYNGNMVALDIISGNLIWSRNIGSLTNIIVEDGVVYILDQESRVIALNTVDGSIIWNKSNLMYNQLISIVLYKEYILLGDSGGYLYCLYKKDGSFFGKQKVSVSYFNYLMVAYDKIVLYENDGKLSVWSFVQ